MMYLPIIIIIVCLVHVVGKVRFATFNASLNRNNLGQLATELNTTGSVQPSTIAEIIQRVRPDIVLINEFDYDPMAVQLFQQNYLSQSYNGSTPISYNYTYIAPSNTGIPTGFDLDNNGVVSGGNDAYGFGFFPGQFGLVIYSKYPILSSDIRTFQNFLWKDMPNNLLPIIPNTTDKYYNASEEAIFRLSSKSHWDVPINVNGDIIHFLVSHPTPPVFDGPEDRNGRRNYDEIRFWADYIDNATYIYDDRGKYGGLTNNSLFVIAGDQNSDPFDGDSVKGAAQLLLNHPKINNSTIPSSVGGTQQSTLQGMANLNHTGDPQYDTADFCGWDTREFYVWIMSSPVKVLPY